MSSDVLQSDGSFVATTWSIRLSVRTTDFHSVKTSSTLVYTTINNNKSINSGGKVNSNIYDGDVKG